MKITTKRKEPHLANESARLYVAGNIAFNKVIANCIKKKVMLK